MYLYLDESGDLGFDFENKCSSKYFVITLLKLSESNSIKLISKAISKTLEIKLNNKKKSGRLITEVKGNSTTLQVKKYFLNYLHKRVPNFVLYSIVLDKINFFKHHRKLIKNRIYNHMTHQLLEKIDFSSATRVNLTIDRSKNAFGIKEFNDYLYANLSLCLNLETKLYISHESSEENKGIQAVDMFCYGIGRKYELNDESWYNLFKEKIAVECKFKA
jgi:hypothetical protein